MPGCKNCRNFEPNGWIAVVDASANPVICAVCGSEVVGYKNMNDLQIKQVETILNHFPEVTWDRWSGEPSYFIVFGWIDRDDQYKDFV